MACILLLSGQWFSPDERHHQIAIAPTHSGPHQGIKEYYSGYWYLAFHNTESIVFSANQAFFRCESGTLYTNRLEDENGSPVLEIAVKDCKIGDHTLSVYFKGILVDSY